MRPLPVADRGNKYWCSGRNLSPLQGEINFGHRKLVAAERSASTFTLYRFIVFSKLNIYRGVAQFGGNICDRCLRQIEGANIGVAVEIYHRSKVK